MMRKDMQLVYISVGTHMAEQLLGEIVKNSRIQSVWRKRFLQKKLSPLVLMMMLMMIFLRRRMNSTGSVTFIIILDFYKCTVL